MLRTIGFLALLFIGINAYFPVNHHNCTFQDEDEQPTGKGFSIEVSNCTNPDRCPLYRGTQHDIKFCFNCTEDSSKDVHMQVLGDFGMFTVPYGQPHPMCDTVYQLRNGTLTCSSTGGMMSDERYCFETKFNVSDWYPKVSLYAKFVIKDLEKAQNIACVRVPVQITDVDS